MLQEKKDKIENGKRDRNTRRMQGVGAAVLIGG